MNRFILALAALIGMVHVYMYVYRYIVCMQGLMLIETRKDLELFFRYHSSFQKIFCLISAIY